MLAKAVMRELASTNGGLGLTVHDLAERLGAPLATIRQTMADLVFRDKSVTCDKQGRYKIGDPSRLMTVGR